MTSSITNVSAADKTNTLCIHTLYIFKIIICGPIIAIPTGIARVPIKWIVGDKSIIYSSNNQCTI